jgi:hypothetical protein
MTLLPAWIMLGPPQRAAFAADPSHVDLVIDTSRTVGDIDLTRYALGQGGLSSDPMFDSEVPQISQLNPQTIRLFVLDHYDIYPAHGVYQWAKLDRAIETILATGAKPMMCLAIKPHVLYPKIDQDIVHPSNYQEWEQLIYQLVKHCNEERKFGIVYWEVGNEGDIGEDGGCPYRFRPDDYVTYYAHTAAAILRADPAARVGGPAAADYQTPIIDALIAQAGAGKIPLHFISWHMYDSHPADFRESIRTIKAKLGNYPGLGGVETVLDEWNMSLGRPEMNPYFQPAFILEVTQVFKHEGLSRSGYYHIRDWYVDLETGWKSMSAEGEAVGLHFWNVTPQFLGLYDNQGRVRPAYYAFLLLRLIKGREPAITGTNADVKAFAAADEHWTDVVLWNFPGSDPAQSHEVDVRFPADHKGSLRVVRLNPEVPVNNLEVLRSGKMADLDAQPLRLTVHPYEIFWVEIGR